jgi:hypothetical protein
LIIDGPNTVKEEEKIARLFFTGSPLIHIDETYGIIRNRLDTLIKISSKINIYNPGYLPHEYFINEMKTSKYSLDLLGVGDPNIRTFEILSTGSLRIGEKSNLQWTFEEEFAQETIFIDENDLFEKLLRLENDPVLYQQCLEKQNEIVRKYMNREAIRNYILRLLP